MIDLEYIRQRVESIRRVACDFEQAHGLEDQLWEEVLGAIANGEIDDPSLASEMAHESLKTREIKFGRYCA